MIFYEDGRGDTLGEDLCEPRGASNDPLFDDEYSLHFQTALNSFFCITFIIFWVPS